MEKVGKNLYGVWLRKYFMEADRQAAKKGRAGALFLYSVSVLFNG
jgi:hypothetical protein